MKNIKPAFLLISILFSTYSFAQTWKLYADSAKAFADQRNHTKAIELYTKAKEELKKDSLGTNSYGRICYDLGFSFYSNRQLTEAEQYYLEAMQIQEKVQQKYNAAYATSCRALGLLYSELGQFDKAESLLLDAHKIRKKILGKEHPDYARSCFNLAILYLNTGQNRKAEVFSREARDIQGKVLGKEDSRYANSCAVLAGIYRNLKLFAKAVPLELEAKQIREKVSGKEHPDYATSCLSLANLYGDMGEYLKAETLFLEARQIQSKVLGIEHPEYASCCYALGVTYYYMGQYEKAEPLFLEAKEIRERVLGKLHPFYAVSCSELANFYSTLGLYEKSESLQLEAKQIREKSLGKMHPEYAGSCNNLANLYRNIGQYVKAEKLYIEAKQIQEKLLGRNHPDYAFTCLNLAITYKIMGYYEKAEPLYMEAKQIQEKVLGKEHPDYAYTCDAIGTFYRLIKKYKKAEALYREAMQIEVKQLGKQHPDYAGTCGEYATLYFNMGQYEKAESLYLEENKILKKIVGKEHCSYAVNCQNTAILYWNLNKPEKAIDLYNQTINSQNSQVKNIFQFTSEVEKQAYLKTITEIHSYLLSFLSAYPQYDHGISYDFSLSNRNLILTSSQQLRSDMYGSNDTNFNSKYIQWTGIREQLALHYTKPLKERPVYVKNLEEQSNKLEKELTRISSAFTKAQSQKTNTWENIQLALKTNEAAIEFAEYQYFNGKRWTDSTLYVALLLTKNMKEPKLIPLFEKKQLNKYKTIASLYRRDDKGHSAYELIWEPIEKHLKNIARIYFAPAGLLHSISFQALPVNNVQVLSDKYQLVQLNSTASIVDQPLDKINISDKIYMFGGIHYDVDTTAWKNAVAIYHKTGDENTRTLYEDSTRGGSTWNYLPGSKKEINEIEKLGNENGYSVIASNGLEASEEAIKALNGKLSPAILHIATHGFFFPDPKSKKSANRANDKISGKAFKQSDNPLFRSGLLFAGANYGWQNKRVKGIDDGILTAYEVSNLYLPNTKLVVLSACETGLGQIEGSEGVYGLQRSFKIAGVDNLVMSLWKVPDQETAELMQEFYKNLFAKQTINDAFYHAQTTMKNKYRNNPYKWAAWVLVR